MEDRMKIMKYSAKSLFKSLTIISLMATAPSSFALVDYTEPEFQPQRSGATSLRAPKPKSVKKLSAPAKSNSGPLGTLNMGISHGFTDVELEGNTGKVNTTKIEAHFQTQYNIYMDVDYWQASSSSEFIGEGRSGQKGNPQVILGFNWLQFGGAADAANIDLYGGASFGQKGSTFATERTRKIFGVKTAKRFNQFALGLGYELGFNDTPDSDEEKAIGSIRKLQASLGWFVSPDIRFILEGSTYKVSKSDAVGRANVLESDLSFSSITPKAHLNLSPWVMLELGATFRTRRVKDADTLDAKLWDMEGAYGNSMFASLGIRI